MEKKDSDSRWWVYARGRRDMVALWARNTKLDQMYWVSRSSGDACLVLKQEFQRW